jgi:hypothetical protein
MDRQALLLGRALAEVLRLQRWAGGECADGLSARLFGLLHGFETILNEEIGEEETGRELGISNKVQTQVEEVLDELDGRDGDAGDFTFTFKDRMHKLKIEETDADKVMQLCLLQDRFPEVIKKIRREAEKSLGGERSIESQWFGSLHYLELIDVTEGVEKKMYAVMSPCVPRIGETMEPEAGSLMKVVHVRYCVSRQMDSQGCAEAILVPYVLLEPVQQDDEDAEN